LPFEQPNSRHIYNQFVIRVERRDEMMADLRECGIGSEVYYPIPIHLQRSFGSLGYRAGDFPISEALANQSLALPIYSELTPEMILSVCQALN
jgi:dTDP-4-amino-4,6-dideoxygalactose transaminase